MSLFGSRTPPPEREPAVQVQVTDHQPHNYYLNQQNKPTSRASTPSQSPPSDYLRSLFDVGIFRDTIAPSFALHSGLAIVAWGVGRATDRVEAKDWLWPAGSVINAWWTAVGRRLIVDGTPVSSVFSSLSWVERLLLTGVTLWGTRLFYRMASRSLKRGKDDPRYNEVKKQEGFWNKSLVTTYLPEAIAQTIISLPFTAPFGHRGQVLTGYHPVGQAMAVALFSSGFALETLADYQLEQHTKAPEGGLLREGVWSIVRHPNYLGDALIHFSFPLLLYSSDMLAPLELLGPLANYLFLRYIGGDAENEPNQMARYEKEDPVKKGHLEKYQEEKNSFWPGAQELTNAWTWAVVGAGALGVVVERGFRAIHHA
ncbi:MAG: hypothetical protein Q9162_006943 [Coniocarpon cinnabarinum]